MVEISDNSREFSHMSSSNVDMYRHQVEDNIASKYEPIVLYICIQFLFMYIRKLDTASQHFSSMLAWQVSFVSTMLHVAITY
jgi:hypothetical protein